MVQASSYYFTRYALLLLLPVLLLSFFSCFFGRRKWRNIVGEERRCGFGERRRATEALHRGRRRWSLGLLRPNPKRRHFKVPVFFLNQNTPKRHRFEVLDFFFFKRHLQNNVVLGLQQLKRRRFVCLNLKPYKNPLFLVLHPKTLKKPLQKHSQSWIEERRRKRLKEVFFSFFLFLL